MAGRELHSAPIGISRQELLDAGQSGWPISRGAMNTVRLGWNPCWLSTPLVVPPPHQKPQATTRIVNSNSSGAQGSQSSPRILYELQRDTELNSQSPGM